VAYDNGWKGINIDANPETINLFNCFRPNDKNINCGVSDKYDELNYYMYEHPACNSFIKGRWDEKELQKICKVSVEPLNSILEKLQVEHIDFLDIDVEGYDEKIVMTFDWKRYEPKVVLIEQESLEDVYTSDIYKKMKQEGYRLYSYSVITAMYVK